MSTILLTGASGFVGKALLAELSQRHHVITLTRRGLPAGENQTHYRGVFSDFEDLRQLDGLAIDGVVHLAAVTGGCLERDGMLVNVEGTRCLMRYLIDRGCRKFVNASSIAAVGFQSVEFRPLQLPIPDEHPCLDRDGYGVSKYLMEEVTRYLHRQNPAIDVINLRLASIYPDERPGAKVRPGKIPEWTLGHLTQMSHSKAVEAFARAVESPLKPGVRILNAVSQSSWCEGPLADVLYAWWGADYDLGEFEALAAAGQPSVYDSTAIERELGFVAK